MTLAEFLDLNKITEAELASRAGISREMINRLKNGHVWPSKDTAEKIKAATGGEVLPNDFLPDAEARPFQ